MPKMSHRAAGPRRPVGSRHGRRAVLGSTRHRRRAAATWIPGAGAYRPPRAPGWASEADQLTSTLPDRPVTLVAGCSGCLVAVRLALAQPDAIERLLLAWPPSAGDPVVDDARLRGHLASLGACLGPSTTCWPARPPAVSPIPSLPPCRCRSGCFGRPPRIRSTSVTPSTRCCATSAGSCAWPRARSAPPARRHCTTWLAPSTEGPTPFKPTLTQ
jgi:pimeloyl-ACP methyl ester carboxylesterase